MRSIAVLLTVSLAGCASAKRERIVLDPGGLLRVTGTFSNLRVIDQQGVFGAEVRIAVTQEPPYQAIVQLGNGDFCLPEERGAEPCFRVSNLMVVEAQFDWERNTHDAATVRFALPDVPQYAGTFEGSVSDQWLDGVFLFRSGKRLAVRLRRGGSHWDVDRFGMPSNIELQRTRPAHAMEPRR